MRRRDLLAFLSGCGAALCTAWSRAGAQGGKTPRIGYITHGSGPSSFDKAFAEGLNQLGFVPGENIHIEYRFADGRSERLPGLVSELIEAGVDVLVTAGSQSTRRAIQATSKIPIVTISADPLARGFVTNLARPGGNVTGRSYLASDLSRKRLDIVREMIPGLSRIAVLFNAQDPDSPGLEQTEEMGRAVGLSVLRVPGAERGLEEAITTAAENGAQAAIILSQGLAVSPDRSVGSTALRHGVATIFGNRAYVAAGGLMSYGPNLVEVYRATATQVDRILKGAKPGDLPIEAPTKFELVINLRTATALGLDLPASFLAGADEVLE